jgi:hypothetical protein
MKKFAIILMMSIVLIGTLSAQNIVRTNVETTTISGKLALVNGLIAVQNGDETYFALGFHHLINFIDGLKEGAEVTLEGYLMPVTLDAENQYFMSTKLTLNGKSYELQTPNGHPYMQWGFQNNMNPWQNNRDQMLRRNTDQWQNNRNRLHDRGWYHHDDHNPPRTNRGRR